MDLYLIAKWAHILSSTILFGTGLGTALHMWLTHLTGNEKAIAVTARNVVRADWWFTTPSGIFQPLSGAVLIWQAGYDWNEGWLLATYGLYLLALCCWLPVVWLQLRACRMAERAVVEGQPLPEAYFRYMRRWFWLGWPAFIALITIFYLMVARPG
ncbi:DUF2269 family protein [Aestuariispira insulae]|uniref:Putative membrane protein n=1 Tax=Aestuariispira insulae TaxID=1461337 RepID=A0A3D9HXP3_9PROT|nr:DUF2269 domain-containing protein [Aestuariispira insulae]RED54277.1 putative membrane protein [Aestuariispira insulae]